jgi:hypothetical protein
MHHQLFELVDLTTLTINQLRERESLLIHAMTSHSLSDAEYQWLTQHLMATRIEINRRMRLRPRM